MLREWFDAQLDYLSFWYGLSLLLLALSCLRLAGHHIFGRLPWQWLGVFGLLHGIWVFTETAARGLADPPFFALVRTVLLAVSLISLFEFARRGLQIHVQKTPGIWLTALLFALCIAPAYHGLAATNAFLHYLLALPGGLAAAWVLWHTAGTVSHQRVRRSMQTAAGAMCAYALFAGIVVPQANIFPASWLNYDSWFAATAFPMQMALLVIILTLVVGTWFAGRQPSHSHTTAGLFGRWLLVAVLLLLTIGSGFAVNWRAAVIDTRMRDELIRQSVAIANAVKPQWIAALEFTPADVLKPEFQRLSDQLSAYGSYLGNIRGIYSIAMRDGRFYFGPESYHTHDPMVSLPGTKYVQYPDELHYVFGQKQPLTIGPYSDEYGNFISALVPVIAPNTGDVMMVVGVDVKAAKWQARIAGERLLVLLLAALPVIVLLFGMALLQWRARFSQKHSPAFLNHAETITAAGLGLVLTITAALMLHDNEIRSQQQKFLSVADSKTMLIQRELEDVSDDLAGIARFFEGSEYVDRWEYDAYTGPMAHFSKVRAWEWVPIVPAAEKTRFESDMRQQGYAGYRIFEFDDNGQKVPVSERPVYYPVAYISPFAGNETLQGYDLGSEPQYHKTIEIILQTRMPKGIYTVFAGQNAVSPDSVFLFHPVCKPEHETPSGFIAALLHLPSFIERTLTSSGYSDLQTEMGLIDITVGDTPVLLAHFPQLAQLHAIDLHHDALLKRFTHTSFAPLFAFGQALIISVHPPPLQPYAILTGNAGRTVIAGLLLTIAVTLLIWVLRNREFMLESHVLERTRELLESRERLDLATRGTGIGIWDYSIDDDRLTWDDRMFELFEISKDEFNETFADWSSRVVPEALPEAMADFQAALSGEKDFFIEFPIRKPDGEVRFIAAAGFVVRDENNNPMRFVGINYDITERKRMEDELLFQTAVLDQISDYVTATDLEGRIVYVNEAECNTFGKSKEELIGKLTTVYGEDPQDGAAQREIVEATLRDGQWQGDVINFDSNGNRCVMHCRTSIMYRDGKPSFLIGVSNDITERKRMEELLRDREEDLFITLQSIGDGVISTDPEGFITRMNPQAEHLTGWTAGQAIGQPISEVFRISNAKSGQPTDCPVQRALQTGETQQLSNDTTLLTRDGKERQIADSVAPIRDAADNIRGAVLVFNDVSEQYRLREILKEREARLAGILHTAPIGIGVLVERTFQEVNEAMCRMTGYSHEELVGQNARMLYVSEEEYITVGREMRRQFAKSGSGTYETRWRTKNGTVIDVLLSTTLLVADNLAAGVTFSALDITDRKRIEDATRLATVGQLAAGVAHEFNNILAVIKLGAQNTRLIGTASAYERLADIVEEQVDRGAKICMQLAAFSRPRASKYAPVCVEEAIRGALGMAAHQLQIGDITIELDERARPVKIMADTGKLEQVFLNLFVNACHAMPDGGTLLITTEHEAEADTPGYVVVHVSDTGIGMSNDILRHIFEPFYTTKGVVNDSDLPGTGLGLSVSHGIITAHGGSIKAKSETGRGTTFEIRLPALISRQQPENTPDS